MSSLKSKIAKYMRHPGQAVMKVLIKMDMLRSMSDASYLKFIYRANIGKQLNLYAPVTFNEKLQWLKLHYRLPIMIQMVDKHLVKEYVAQAIGAEYIIPTLGVYDTFDEIDFDTLPKQFVIKCTHDSGGLVVCRDKAKLDIEAARRKINKSLKRNYFYYGREWPYLGVKPRIIVEEYMEDPTTRELRDYKFFCFDGKVKALYIASDRQKEDEETKFDFFDENGRHLPVRNGHPNADTPPALPAHMDKMKELAEKLSAGFPHMRVDFYDVAGKIYFGEITFFHNCGTLPFEPEEWDATFGSWLRLPEPNA